MHNNIEEKQTKKKKFSTLCIIGLILVLLIGMAGSMIAHFTSREQSDDTPKYDLTNAVEVSDAATLQELLAMEEDIEIVVTKDFVIPESMVVKGNKTVYGDSTLIADIDALAPYQLLDVTPNASLTMAGLTLDGNGIATGIKVQEGAKLTYLEGAIQWGMSYGIEAYGEVTIKDVDISECDVTGVYVGYKGNVYAEGGTYHDCYNVLMLVEAGGTLEIGENALLDTSLSHAIRNRGKLEVNGGTIQNTGKYAIHNTSELIIEYAGSNEDGRIKILNTGEGMIYNSSTGTVVAKDIYGEDIGGTTLNLKGGTAVVENWEVKNIKSHGIYINGGTADMSDVIFDTCGATGAYVINPGTLNMNDVTIKNAGKHGVMAYGGNITGSNVTLEGVANQGVYNTADKNGIVGKFEITGLKVSGVVKNNVYMANKDAVITLKDAVLEASKRTNCNIGKGTLILNNVKVKGTLAEDCPAISVGKEAVVNLYDTEITDGKIRGLTIKGVVNMHSGSIHGHHCVKESGGAVRIEKTGTFNMFGGKIYDNRTELAGGAVYVVDNGNFNMKGGSINNNVAKNSGGAIQLAMYSTMNLSGDAKIYENKTEKGSGGAILVYGTLNMSGGEIAKNVTPSAGGGISLNARTDTKKNTIVGGVLNMSGGSLVSNKATKNGGAICVNKDTKATLSGGNIQNNICKTSADGIYNNGSIEISDSFCMEGNQLTLASASKYVKIKNNTLTSHSKENPLVVEAYYYTKADTVIAECDSESAASSLLNYVASGNGSYTFAQKGSNIVVNYASVDMDMTGADTVYVNNYQELKDAIESTTSKRYVVICFDILMEGSIKVPGGTTICITDDGNPRTIKRADGNNTNFIATSYGTGLHLVGTKEGYLTFDGECSSKVTAEKTPQLVTVRGETRIENVTFSGNGKEGNTTMGAFVEQKYGKIEIINSTFNGANGGGGAAIYIAEGDAVIEKSKFTDNISSAGGGAIRVEGTLHIVDTEFTGNVATSVGGAINCDGGVLTAENCTFSKNEAKSSGAVYLTNQATATFENTKFVGNTSATYAGAVMTNKSGATFINCEFDENSAQLAGGAIRVTAKSNVIVEGGTFDNNFADEEGGGAILVEATGNFSVSNATFSNHNLTGKKAYGAAIKCEEGTVVIENSEFAKNTAVGSGGAIYNSLGTVNVTESTFTENTSKVYGGAIYITNKGVLTVVDSEFSENVATKRGGAIDVNKGDVSVSGSTFKDNQVNAENCGDAMNLAQGSQMSLSDTAFVGTGAEVTFVGSKADTLMPLVLSGNVTGVTFRYEHANTAHLGIGKEGIDAACDITIIPKQYAEDDVVLCKAEDADALVLADAATIIKVPNDADAGEWNIAADGTLESYPMAQIGTKVYNSLKLALEEAVSGDTVYMLRNVSLTETVTVSGEKEVTITNAENIDVVITRDVDITLFEVESGSTLRIIGTGDNTITLNGNKESVKASKTMIENYGIVTLGTNTCLVNAKGTGAGPVLRNYTGASATFGGTVIVQDNETSNSGGAIYNNGGTLTINGGTFSGNEAKHGGVINNNEDGVIVINGGAFSGNTTSGNGGVINSSSTQVITISGGTFSGNTAEAKAGVVCYYGTKTTDAVMELSNCTMTGNTSAYPNCDINIVKYGEVQLGENVNGGIVRLEKNTASILLTSKLTNTLTMIPSDYTVGNTVVTFADSMGDDDKITSAEMSVVNYQKDENSEIDSTSYWVDEAGKLQYGEAIIDSVSYKTLAAAWNAAKDKDVIYVQKDVIVGATMTLAEGDAKEITLMNVADRPVTITRNSNVTLFEVKSGNTLHILGNGDNTITLDGNKANVTAKETTMIANSGTFTLGENASLVNAKADNYAGPALRNNAGATAILSGTVSYNETTNNGGAIYNKGILTINKGTYEYNNAKHGGLIKNAGTGTVEIIAGTYDNNTATGNGGVIHSDSTGDITITGGSIANNSANNAGIIYYYSGKLSVSNCTITGNSSIALDCDIWALKDGSLELGALKEGSEMAVVHLERPTTTIKLTTPLTSEMTVILGAAHDKASNNFKEGDQVIDGSGDLTSVNMIKVHYHTSSETNTTDYWINTDGTLQYGEAMIGETSYLTLLDALEAVESGETIVVKKDVTLDSAVTVSGKNITLTNMAGKNVKITRHQTEADMFTVESGSSLTILGTEKNTITIDGNKAGLSNAVGKTMIANSGTFILGENASLVNAKGTGAGLALRNYGTATLSGTISGNETTNNGGAIYNNGGTLNITSGTYSENKANGSAKNGGLINNNAGGNITISGGTFSGNTATAKGGVINSSSNGVVITITGGSFTGNRADDIGGVLSCVNTAIVKVSGCDMISDTSSNTSGYPNCDIAVRNNTTLEIGKDANIGVVYFEKSTSKLSITATLTKPMTVILPGYEEGQIVVTSFGSEVDASASVSQMTIRKYEDKSTYSDTTYSVDSEGKLQKAN